MADLLVPAPLYVDPPHLAPTDPTVIEGPDGRWWMFYTQRHAHDEGAGVGWIHGIDIGTAVSDDGGLTWDYRGVVEGISPDPGRNTLWAPEVIWAEGRFHFFVTYIEGAPDTWIGDRHILHHVSDDLVTWSFAGVVPLSSDRVIDACVHPLPAGGYRMWFKDEDHDSTTWAADSADLTTWGESRPVIVDHPHEGPNVFALGGWFWMVVDEWRGLAVHRSTDLDHWERQGLILDRPGVRAWDQTLGRHADVVVSADAAGEAIGWIFYFTHRVEPGLGDPREQQPGIGHRTDVHAASLRVVDGVLVCDRDTPTDLDLRRKLAD